MSYWYKSANTLIDDTKLRLISARLKISHCETVATFHSLLERCSKDSNEIFGECIEEVAEEIDLQLGVSDARAILREFESKQVILGCKLLKWNDYQANTSTQRVREWRQKKKDETLRNVTATDVTQTRLDKNRIDIEEMKKKFPLVDILLQKEKFEDYIKSSGKKYKDKNAAFRNWCRRSEEYRLEKAPQQPTGKKQLKNIMDEL